MTYVQKLSMEITRLANSNCMFNKNTDLVTAYSNLLQRVSIARIKRNAKERLLTNIYAIKCNCSDELYNKLVKAERKHG